MIRGSAAIAVNRALSSDIEVLTAGLPAARLDLTKNPGISAESPLLAWEQPTRAGTVFTSIAVVSRPWTFVLSVLG
jgi:hypothetical protein